MGACFAKPSLDHYEPKIIYIIQAPVSPFHPLPSAPPAPPAPLHPLPSAPPAPFHYRV